VHNYPRLTAPALDELLVAKIRAAGERTQVRTQVFISKSGSGRETILAGRHDRTDALDELSGIVMVSAVIGSML
jgi:hypothetical protein